MTTRWIQPLSPLEDLAHRIGLLDRKGALTLEGFDGSGADFPERYKPYLLDGATIITGPHKGYSTSTNDIIFQLRRYRIEKIILAGPVGNLCVEGHMRDFIENGFEVAMVRDATGGAENEEGSGYEAALVNWRFMAHALWTTDEAVWLIDNAGKQKRDASLAAS
jgi:biuret amidohydrolase